MGRGNVYMDYLTDEGNSRSRCTNYHELKGGTDGWTHRRGRDGGRDGGEREGRERERERERDRGEKDY